MIGLKDLVQARLDAAQRTLRPVDTLTDEQRAHRRAKNRVGPPSA